VRSGIESQQTCTHIASSKSLPNNALAGCRPGNVFISTISLLTAHMRHLPVGRFAAETCFETALSTRWTRWQWRPAVLTVRARLCICLRPHAPTGLRP